MGRVMMHPLSPMLMRVSLCQQGALSKFLPQIPLRFWNKATIIRIPALGPPCGERVEYSSSSMFIELNMTLVFVPKIQQPFHKWIFDPLSKKEERKKALPFRLTAGEFWHVLPKATTGWTGGKAASPYPFARVALKYICLLISTDKREETKEQKSRL